MIDYSRATNNRFNSTTNAVQGPKVEESFGFETLKKSYEALEETQKKWRESPNYMGTRPEEGRLLTVGDVQCLIWIDPMEINKFNIRLAFPSRDEGLNRQQYQVVIAELDRQGVVAKRYG